MNGTRTPSCAATFPPNYQPSTLEKTPSAGSCPVLYFYQQVVLTRTPYHITSYTPSPYLSVIRRHHETTNLPHFTPNRNYRFHLLHHRTPPTRSALTIIPEPPCQNINILSSPVLRPTLHTKSKQGIPSPSLQAATGNPGTNSA